MDQRMKHLGCPVVHGDKWIVNKWVKWHHHMFSHPCHRHDIRVKTPASDFFYKLWFFIIETNLDEEGNNKCCDEKSQLLGTHVLNSWGITSSGVITRIHCCVISRIHWGITSIAVISSSCGCINFTSNIKVGVWASSVILWWYCCKLKEGEQLV